jgi:DNA-binding transcriptional LysR family regulator
MNQAQLKEIVGAPLLQRRREGLRLTAAGAALLDASRNVPSLVDHDVSRTRQAAGLGRPPTYQERGSHEDRGLRADR